MDNGSKSSNLGDENSNSIGFVLSPSGNLGKPSKNNYNTSV
jgi:hypothetical protein